MQSLKTIRAFRLIDAALAIGIAAALLFSSPVRGDERKKLYIQFVVNAPHLKFVYGSTGYSRIGRELSDQLAKLGNENYGFLEWISATKEVAPGAHDPVLSVSLKSQDVEIGKTKAFEVFLDSSGYLNGLSAGSKKLISNRQLYRPMQTPPKNVTKLVGAIWEKIADLLEGQNKNDLNDFLMYIPISHRAEVLKNYDRLMVPLCQSQIAAGKDSKMHLKVLSRTSNGDELPANLDLVLDDPIKPKDFPAVYKMIQCNVTMVNFDEIKTQAWHPIIRDVLDQRVPDTLNVYMTTYVKSHSDTVGPVVVTPRQGENRWERADPCRP
jgi:hypothetical protein